MFSNYNFTIIAPKSIGTKSMSGNIDISAGSKCCQKSDDLFFVDLKLQGQLFVRQLAGPVLGH